MTQQILALLLASGTVSLALAWAEPSRAQSSNDPCQRNGVVLPDGTECDTGNGCDGSSACYGGQCRKAGTALRADPFLSVIPLPSPVFTPFDLNPAFSPVALIADLTSRPGLLSAATARALDPTCLLQEYGPPIGAQGSKWTNGWVRGSYYIAVGYAAGGADIRLGPNNVVIGNSRNQSDIEAGDLPALNSTKDMLVAVWDMTGTDRPTVFCDPSKYRAARRIGSLYAVDQPAGNLPSVVNNELTVYIDTGKGFHLGNRSVCLQDQDRRQGISGVNFSLPNLQVTGTSPSFCGRTNQSVFVNFVDTNDDSVVLAGYAEPSEGDEPDFTVGNPDVQIGDRPVKIPLAPTDAQAAFASQATFLARLDPGSGDLRWLKVLAPSLTPAELDPTEPPLPGTNQPAGILRDDEGNIWVAGTFSGNINFGSQQLDSVANSDDIYLAEYTPSGHLLFAKQLGGSGKDTAGFPCPEKTVPCEAPVPDALRIDPNDGSMILHLQTDLGLSTDDASLFGGEYDLHVTPGEPRDCGSDNPCRAGVCSADGNCARTRLTGPACPLDNGNVGTCQQGNCRDNPNDSNDD